MKNPKTGFRTPIEYGLNEEVLKMSYPIDTIEGIGVKYKKILKYRSPVLDRAPPD